MDTKNLFDAFGYFETMLAKNKLASKESFKFCRVTGLSGMEEALDSLPEEAFFCVDDAVSGITFARNGGFFQRRVFTVFVLERHDFGNMPGRALSMAVCRKLANQTLSKMILDSEELGNDLIYLNTSSIKFQETESYALSGCAGLYFVVAVDEPIDLSYDEEQWTE